MSTKSKLSYGERASRHSNAIVQRLFKIAEEKRSNLVLSADVETMDELLSLAEKFGPKIVVLKTHIDMISDFNYSFISQLQHLSTKHNFLIFEDRKFTDIGNTVQKQYGGGIYRIADWAHIVNVSLLPGDGIIEGLERVANGRSEDRAALILSEMTSKGSLDCAAYRSSCVASARKHSNFVIGFVATQSLENMTDLNEIESKGKDEDFVVFATGINMSSSGDELGQQYKTPAEAIHRGADFIMVGRGIFLSRDSLQVAKIYQESGWKAYVHRIGAEP